MSLVRRLVLVVTVAVLVSTAAYGAGWASRHDDRPVTPRPTPVAADRDLPGSAPTRTPAPRPEPTPEPASKPSPKPTPTPEPEPVLRPGPRLLGPGDEGAEVRELQARLAQIDWFEADPTGFYGDVTAAAVRGFQAKREIPVTGEVDRRTLDRLHGMTTEPTDAELLGTADLGNVPGALDARCLTGRVLCIDKTTSTLRWVVDGEVLQTLDTRFGAAATPTREGVFSVYYKHRDHVSSLYGSEMPYAMFFDRGQAVHYSSDFAAVGYAGASHGCVNVRDRDGIARLYDQVQVGDTVVVSWS